MCGIIICQSDLINKKNKSSLDIILSKRGKDQLNQNITFNYTVIHSRLHLFGKKEDGIQPYSSDLLTIVFNGEIYNADNLGEIKKIEILYHRYGERFGDYIKGQYAIIIFDKRKQKIILCRDKYGQKPLFYDTNRNWIGSTLDSHLKLFEFEYNENAYKEFILFGHKIKQDSFISGVSEVKPGQTVCLNKEMDLIKVFDNKFNYDNTNKIEVKLKSAVKNRLDGVTHKYGTLLSGGIDSFLVTYFAKKVDKRGVLESFTTSVEGFRDESKRALISANEIGINTNVSHFKNNKILDYLKLNLYNIYDEPISDPSALLLSMQMQKISNKVRLILTGDGADEVFRGYNRYLHKNLLYIFYLLRLNYIIRMFRGLFSIKAELSQISFTHAFLLWTSKLEVDSFNIFSSTYFSKNELNLWDINYYLPNQINIKLDRASLFYEKEIRSPFLAEEFYYDLKISKSWDFRFKKYPLRNLARKLGYKNSKKSGYSFSWQKLIDEFDIDLIIGYLSNKYKFIDEILKNVKMNNTLKWRLLNLYLWEIKKL